MQQPDQAPQLVKWYVGDPLSEDANHPVTRSWCPDCANTALLTESCAAEHSKRLEIVYVGNKASWKNPDNVYRLEPYNIKSIPTLVLVGPQGEEIKRIECDAIQSDEKLKKFFEMTN